MAESVDEESSIHSSSSRKGLFKKAGKLLGRGRSKSPGPFKNMMIDIKDEPEKSPDNPATDPLALPAKPPRRRRSVDNPRAARRDSRRSSLGVIQVPPEKQRGRDAVNKDEVSVDDTDIAVISPTKAKKKIRRSSFGSHHSAGKTKSKKNLSPRDRSHPRVKPSRTLSNPAGSGGGVDGLLSHLSKVDGGDGTLEAEGKLQETEEEKRQKSRTTVDDDGKIRRVKNSKKKECDEDSDNDGSRMSKRSKGSKKSVSSKTARKHKDRDKKPKKNTSRRVDEKSVESDDTEKFESRPKKERDSSLDRSINSTRSTASTRSRRRTADSERHAGKKDTGPSDDEKDTIGEMPKVEKRENDWPDSKNNESFSSLLSDRSMIKVGTDLVDINPLKTADMDNEILTLNSKITDLQKEQGGAQAEASKLRKELREEKLELQRSQTERRELRAELRERDFIIKESDLKIEALEKAVESQLDKVEDLEEELRRGNEEILILEEKLGHMEAILADSVSVDANGAVKEREFEKKRQERLERRLEEKERELEERERQLSEERKNLLSERQPVREVEQLEQDNRMLLKALNREKEEASDFVNEKDAEINALKLELQRAKQNTSPAAAPASVDESASKGSEGSGAGQEQLKAEHAKSSAALQKKDDTIAFMELELKRLKSEVISRDLGDFNKIKRDLEASTAEAQVTKSKFEGAQRRNLILEDDIDHWKSVNCNLEDELADWKAQAANWRSKYEDVVDVHDDEGDMDHHGSSHTEPSNLNFRMSRANTASAAAISMTARYDSDGEAEEETKNTISNLWSKLTTPTAKKQALGSTLNASALKEAMLRSTFH